MGIFPDAQGQLTPQSEVKPGRNSNSSEMLWLSLLPARMKKIQSKTRIVRGSDYSPASEIFARVRQTMTGNNPKFDLVNVDAHKKIGQILTICSQGIEQKQNSDINHGPKLC